jgi:hypothetical protein
MMLLHYYEARAGKSASQQRRPGKPIDLALDPGGKFMTASQSFSSAHEF